jgi:hypothetical protein
MPLSRLDVETFAGIQTSILWFKTLNLGLSDVFTIEQIKKNTGGKITTCEQYIKEMEGRYPHAKFWEKGNWSLPVGGRALCRVLKTHGRGGDEIRSEIYVFEESGVIAVFHWNDPRDFRAPRNINPPEEAPDHPWDDDWGAGSNSSSSGNHQYSQAELDNHANQCNPNNDAYWSSRK